ncbi:MAG: hypothetical protein AAF702_44525 [Chloroflexota bacterium]
MRIPIGTIEEIRERIPNCGAGKLGKLRVSGEVIKSAGFESIISALRFVCFEVVPEPHCDAHIYLGASPLFEELSKDEAIPFYGLATHVDGGVVFLLLARKFGNGY